MKCSKKFDACILVLTKGEGGYNVLIESQSRKLSVVRNLHLNGLVRLMLGAHAYMRSFLSVLRLHCCVLFRNFVVFMRSAPLVYCLDQNSGEQSSGMLHDVTQCVPQMVGCFLLLCEGAFVNYVNYAAQKSHSFDLSPTSHFPLTTFGHV